MNRTKTLEDEVKLLKIELRKKDSQLEVSSTKKENILFFFHNIFRGDLIKSSSECLYLSSTYMEKTRSFVWNRDFDRSQKLL